MSSGHNLRLQKLHCSQIEKNIQTTLIYLNSAKGISTLQHISGRSSWNLHIGMYPSTKSIFSSTQPSSTSHFSYFPRSIPTSMTEPRPSQLPKVVSDPKVPMPCPRNAEFPNKSLNSTTLLSALDDRARESQILYCITKGRWFQNCWNTQSSQELQYP